MGESSAIGVVDMLKEENELVLEIGVFGMWCKWCERTPRSEV